MESQMIDTNDYLNANNSEIFINYEQAEKK